MGTLENKGTTPAGGENSIPGTITLCLQEWRQGDSAALARLTDAVYRELRRLAAASLRGESSGQTLEPTALVHELYFQLPEVQHIDWQSRGQFLNVAAKMMRNILVDHARKRRAAKRGGGAVHTDSHPRIDDGALDIDVLLVHESLDRLADDYPRHARVVELRFFGGLTVTETAEVLNATGVESSARTVERDWTFARGWLLNAIRAR